MFGKRINLFKLLGFEVRVDLSWIVIAVLVTWSLSKGLFPFQYKGLSPANYWTMGVIGALGLFASIIFHELSHSLIARRYGLPMKGITLFIFGGVAEMDDEPPNSKAEFMMAIAGPVASRLGYTLDQPPASAPARLYWRTWNWTLDTGWCMRAFGRRVRAAAARRLGRAAPR